MSDDLLRQLQAEVERLRSEMADQGVLVLELQSRLFGRTTLKTANRICPWCGEKRKVLSTKIRGQKRWRYLACPQRCGGIWKEVQPYS